MADCKPRLTYFPGRAIAEPIRLAFSAAGIDYEDVYLETREQFLQMITDGKLMFKQVPLLEIDGQCLIGSEVILRYVCQKGGLDGKKFEDRNRIDMLAMGAKDTAIPGIMSLILEAQFSKEIARESDTRGIKDCRERYLPAFEKAFINHFTVQPGIEEYLASPRRHPLPDIEFAKLCLLRVRNVPVAGE